MIWIHYSSSIDWLQHSIENYEIEEQEDSPNITMDKFMTSQETNLNILFEAISKHNVEKIFILMSWSECNILHNTLKERFTEKELMKIPYNDLLKVLIQIAFENEFSSEELQKDKIILTLNQKFMKITSTSKN